MSSSSVNTVEKMTVTRSLPADTYLEVGCKKFSLSLAPLSCFLSLPHPSLSLFLSYFSLYHPLFLSFPHYLSLSFFPPLPLPSRPTYPTTPFFPDSLSTLSIPI